MLNDTHVHSRFSYDGESGADEIIAFADKNKYDYICFTEHYDPDYLKAGIPIPAFDARSYFNTLSKKISEYKGDTIIGIGIEIGYEDIDKIDLPPFDYIINSVHLIGGIDPYYGKYFDGKEKREAYVAYLKRVEQSVDAAFSYDTVGHIGYIGRYAPFEDKRIAYDDYRDLIDMILRKIIARNKSLEINTKAADGFCPDLSVLKRYVELGGENFTFGSDAHNVKDIGRNYGEVADLVKSLGVDYLNIYKYRYAVKMRIK